MTKANTIPAKLTFDLTDPESRDVAAEMGLPLFSGQETEPRTVTFLLHRACVRLLSMDGNSRQADRVEYDIDILRDVEGRVFCTKVQGD